MNGKITYKSLTGFSILDYDEEKNSETCVSKKNKRISNLEVELEKELCIEVINNDILLYKKQLSIKRNKYKHVDACIHFVLHLIQVISL